MCIFSGVLLDLNSFLWMTMREHIGALMVDEYLESENIQPMACAANSLDLNAIEHAWESYCDEPTSPQNHSGVKNCSGRRMGGPTTTTP